MAVLISDLRKSAILFGSVFFLIHVSNYFLNHPVQTIPATSSTGRATRTVQREGSVAENHLSRHTRTLVSVDVTTGSPKIPEGPTGIVGKSAVVNRGFPGSIGISPDTSEENLNGTSGSSDVTKGISDVTGGSSDVTGGSSDVTGGSSDITGGSSDITGESSNVIEESSDVSMGSSNVTGGSPIVTGRSPNVTGGFPNVTGRSSDIIGDVAATVRESLGLCILNYTCREFTNMTWPLRLGPTTTEVIRQEQPDVEVGGAWRPPNCRPKWRIALIIPIRDREAHLRTFIRNIIPFLKNQNAEFTIFAVEQVGEEYFNKAHTMDAGFIEAQKLGNFDCFIFHDVDMVPINPCNIYKCEKNGVRHLGISRDVDHPHKVYGLCIGGASAFTKDHFQDINGFTTVMFGWGGEDDDAYYRVKHSKLTLFRYRPIVANYYSLPHPKFGKKNFPRIHRGKLLYNHWRYMKYDGLNSLDYKVVNVIKDSVFTRIQIQVPGPKTVAAVQLYMSEKRKVLQEMLCKDMICPTVNSTIPTPHNKTKVT